MHTITAILLAVTWLIHLGAVTIVSWIFQAGGETLLVAPIASTIASVIGILYFLCVIKIIPSIKARVAITHLLILAITIGGTVPYAYSHFPGALQPEWWYISSFVGCLPLIICTLIIELIFYKDTPIEIRTSYSKMGTIL